MNRRAFISGVIAAALVAPVARASSERLSDAMKEWLRLYDEAYARMLAERPRFSEWFMIKEMTVEEVGPVVWRLETSGDNFVGTHHTPDIWDWLAKEYRDLSDPYIVQWRIDHPHFVSTRSGWRSYFYDSGYDTIESHACPPNDYRMVRFGRRLA